MTDVELRVVTGVEEALSALDSRRYDCLVVDLKLSGGSGFDVIRRIQDHKDLQRTPIVVSIGRQPGKRDLTRLEQYAQRLVVTSASTSEELISTIGLFLHRADVDRQLRGQLPEAHAEGDDQVFAGKRVLIVDDDVRNVFALASALEQHGLEVQYAEGAEEGLDILNRDPDVDLVLMDVMMPGMDGYTAMGRIRAKPQFAELPIIAVTAKAMPGDREDSLRAGASGYVAKPVDIDELLTMFRRWLG